LQLGEEDRALKVESVRRLYVDLGVKEAAEDEILTWHRKALEELDKTGIAPQQTRQLRLFAEGLIHREK
jgi:hypothetical protein